VEPGLLKRRSGKDAKVRGVGSQPMRVSTDSGEVPRAHILMPFSSDQVVCYMRFHISCKTAGPCVGRARRWLRWQQCRSKAAIVSFVPVTRLCLRQVVAVANTPALLRPAAAWSDSPVARAVAAPLQRAE
jgi:hypothetical protein